MRKANTSTKRSSGPLETALGGVPEPFRKHILTQYHDLRRRLRSGEYDAAGLSAGKLCEAVLRLLQHLVAGTYVPFGKKIPNFPDDCRAIITATAPQVVESLRVIVPRALVFLYTMRNKRGIGHAGGDVDANAVDLATMGRVADWVICELVRCFYSVSLEEAQDIVDSLAQRSLPDVWEIAGKKRVLRSDLSALDRALVLLYSTPDQAVPSEDLLAWVEYKDLPMFRIRVLRPLHKSHMVEYDQDTEMVYLSPLGVKRVEDSLLAS